MSKIQIVKKDSISDILELRELSEGEVFGLYREDNPTYGDIFLVMSQSGKYLDCVRDGMTFSKAGTERIFIFNVSRSTIHCRDASLKVRRFRACMTITPAE